jgi:signal peptidase I
MDTAVEAKKEGGKKFLKDAGKIFRAFWHLLWKDNSPKGWIFSIVFLFVFIKFIFFPLLNLATGTILPLAIVESCSMYHEGNLLSNFNNWFSQHQTKYAEYGNINQTEFNNFIFKKGLNKGDILFIIGVKPKDLKVGDVIIFNAGQSNPIIHRIISIQKTEDSYTFSTIGDNNNAQLSFEKSITENEIIGKPIAKIGPYIGWIKLIFYEGSKPASERGLCTQN